MKTSIRLLLWACCGLLGCGMASCAGVSGNKYGSFPPDYGNTLTRTTADGKITGLPNDLSDRWGQGETDVWDGTEDLSWYTANPDAKIFHIATAEQLAGLASLSSKEDFEGCTILLTANLILNERVKIDGDYNVRNDKKLKKWMPIQNFRGTFDGRGHVISGLYINNLTENYQGLFGNDPEDADENDKDDWGNVYNLGIVNSYIEGRDVVSAIGVVNRVRNCFSTAVVKGRASTAGVGGQSAHQCFHKGVVISDRYVLGISFGTNFNCYNAGILIGMTRLSYILPLSDDECCIGYNLFIPKSSQEIFYADKANVYRPYSEQGNLVEDGCIATFADNSGILTALPGKTLLATTLVGALNYSTVSHDYRFMNGESEHEITYKPSKEKVWTVDPERNCGYPIFVNDIYDGE